MVDIFSLALTHGLLLLAAYKLLQSDELDREDVPGEEPPRA